MKFRKTHDTRLKAFLKHSLGPGLLIPRKTRLLKQDFTDVQIPPQFIARESTLYEVFKIMANKYRDDNTYAIELLKLLPSSLKSTWVWLDRITNLWRYKYGIPYKLPDGSIVSGHNVHLPVDELYCAIKIADLRLTRKQLIDFRERLSDRAKHSDVLFEMRPIKKLKGNFSIGYEVAGLGEGNTTLDWVVTGFLFRIAIEVKNRIESLIEHLKEAMPQANDGAVKISSSAPNPEKLFRSAQNKFKEKCFIQQIQGVWIHTDVKEDDILFKRYFKKELNKKKVHFVILSDWKDDSYIIARNPFITIILKKVFRLRTSRRFVARTYENGEVIQKI